MYECGVCCVGCWEGGGEGCWSWLVCSPQLLNHDYNANTIKYRHKYKMQIQIGMLELTLLTHNFPKHPPHSTVVRTMRIRCSFDTSLSRPWLLAPLPHPAHPPPCIFSEGQLVGADLSLLIDVLLSTLNSPLFFPAIKCHTKLLLYGPNTRSSRGKLNISGVDRPNEN